MGVVRPSEAIMPAKVIILVRVLSVMSCHIVMVCCQFGGVMARPVSQRYLFLSVDVKGECLDKVTDMFQERHGVQLVKII